LLWFPLLSFLLLTINIISFRIGIPNKEVIESHAPYYKNLTIEKMFEFAENYGHVFKYFPDKRDIYRLPRQFVINVMATVIKEPFEKWIDEQI